MANQNTKTAFDAVNAARNNPYVKQIIEDEELRDAVRSAFESMRDAYGRISDGKSAQKVVMDDKKFHRDLKRAAEALGDAGSALRQGPRRERRVSLGRKLLIVMVVAIAALAISNELRDRVLDLLFGGEEEFDYTSTTTPSATPSPEPASF